MTKALVIVDMQNDFMPGGALGVPGANEIIPIINALMTKFPIVVATLDWHPHDHKSFAVNHTGKKVGDIVDVRGIQQILWPVHCVKNTPGSKLVSELNQDKINSFFYKGTDPFIDSYSAFFDNARGKSTGLSDFLRSRAVTEITIVGLCTDYCVLYSVVDAIDLGYKVNVVTDACCGIDLFPGDVEEALKTMAQKGAKLITSKEV